MTRKFDLLTRRGPRWAWDQLDTNLDAYKAEVMKITRSLGALIEIDNKIKSARDEIKSLGPESNVISFEAEVESDSSLTGKADVNEEGDKPDVAGLTMSLDVVQMIRKWG